MLAGNSGYDPNFDASLSYGNDPANIRGGLDAINSPAYPPAPVPSWDTQLSDSLITGFDGFAGTVSDEVRYVGTGIVTAAGSVLGAAAATSVLMLIGGGILIYFIAIAAAPLAAKAAKAIKDHPEILAGV